MKVKDIIAPLEELAPLNYAESFDNVGLLVGDAEQEVTGVLITLDTLEPVIDEAIAIGSNLIISFHPIIFSLYLRPLRARKQTYSYTSASHYSKTYHLCT